MAIRVAVDAMGGDDAPGIVIDGALRALASDPGSIHVLFVGPAERIEHELEKRGAGNSSMSVIDAPEHIGMHEPPANAVKTKKRSSIHIGLMAQKQQKADAFISAGNTGAIMAASLFILGRLPNIARPTVISFFPTLRGTAVVLDAGANVDCRSEHLLQFARMGSLYVEHILKRENPSVGLMNVGEEPGKGNELAKGAYELMKKEEALNFVGNVEGSDIMQHAADVVVCDGFVGNILLKFGESLPDIFSTLMSREMETEGISEKEQQIINKLIETTRKQFSYEEYGGAPLLGVDGTVFVGHGCSTPRALKQLVLSAANAVRNEMTPVIASAFTHPTQID